jgi:hypothetical protein
MMTISMSHRFRIRVACWTMAIQHVLMMRFTATVAAFQSSCYNVASRKSHMRQTTGVCKEFILLSSRQRLLPFTVLQFTQDDDTQKDYDFPSENMNYSSHRRRHFQSHQPDQLHQQQRLVNLAPLCQEMGITIDDYESIVTALEQRQEELLQRTLEIEVLLDALDDMEQRNSVELPPKVPPQTRAAQIASRLSEVMTAEDLDFQEDREEEEDVHDDDSANVDWTRNMEHSHSSSVSLVLQYNSTYHPMMTYADLWMASPRQSLSLHSERPQQQQHPSNQTQQQPHPPQVPPNLLNFLVRINKKRSAVECFRSFQSDLWRSDPFHPCVYSTATGTRQRQHNEPHGLLAALGSTIVRCNAIAARYDGSVHTCNLKYFHVLKGRILEGSFGILYSVIGLQLTSLLRARSRRADIYN